MGKITRFLRSIVPVLERRALRGELAELQERYTEQLRPAFDDFRGYFDNRQMKSNEAKNIERSIVRASRLAGVNSLSVTLGELYNVVGQHLEVLSKEVDRLFSSSTPAEGMTFKQANIVAYLGELSEFMDAGLRVQYLVTAQECAASGGIAFRPNRGEAAINEAAIATVCSLAPVLLTSLSDLGKAIRQLTDAVVDEESEEMLGASTPVKTLLIRNSTSGAFGGKYNFAEIIGKLRVERQVDKYNRNKEQRAVDRLRLQELREIEQDLPNENRAKIQRLIQAIDGRIGNLDYKIAKFEETYLKDKDEWS